MSLRSAADYIIHNIFGAGRNQDVDPNERGVVSRHNGSPSGVYPSNDSLAPMQIEANKNTPPHSASAPPAMNPGSVPMNNSMLPPAMNQSSASLDMPSSPHRDGNDSDGDIPLSEYHTPQPDEPEPTTTAHSSSTSRFSTGDFHLLPSFFKRCGRNAKHTFAPGTGGYICNTCDYVTCTDCANEEYEESGNPACPECNTAMTYDDTKVNDAEDLQDKEMDLDSMLRAQGRYMIMLGRQIPVRIKRNQLGLRAIRDKIILSKHRYKKVDKEYKLARNDPAAKESLIKKLKYALQSAKAEYETAQLDRPYMELLERYLELRNKNAMLEKECKTRRANADSDRKQRITLARAAQASFEANVACKTTDPDELLDEDEHAQELRAAQKRQRAKERYAMKRAMRRFIARDTDES